MLKEIKKSKVLILGFGVEGQATLRYLQKQFPEKKLGIADRNADIRCQMLDVRYFFGENYLKNLSEFDLIIKSPGIKPDLPELVEFKKHGGKITSATNIFMSQVKGTVIGVTGSKGKSTVSSLLYEVLKQARKEAFLIGNIGNPALDILGNNSEDSFYVYEMSSYQLEDLEKKPQYILINNLFPEHLDYHGTLDKYYEAKMNIVDNDSDQKVFYNAGSEKLAEIIQDKNCNKIAFNDGENSKIQDGILVYKDEEIVNEKDVKLLGKHNLENILGVIAVAKELEIETELIRKVISEFKGLEHRLEYVGEFNGIDFYNDSISTTPESTIQAIEALGEDLDTLIVGGLDRGYNFEELAKRIIQSSIRNLILFPETGERIWEAIKNEKLKMKKFQVDKGQRPLGKHLGSSQETLNQHSKQLQTTNYQLHTVKNMQNCVEKTFEVTGKNKICLLSPASPSYNLFKNFIERGKLYKKFIQEYK